MTAIYKRVTDNGEDSIFIYIPNFLREESALCVVNWLHTLQFISGTSKGGSVISRDQLWFQTTGEYFCKSWKHRYDRWTANQYPDILLNLQKDIQESLKTDPCCQELDMTFNSCLINLYKTGLNKITPHRDSPESFGSHPTIVNLSLGATRVMRIKNKERTLDFELENNSIFIMAGASQLYYMHEILEDFSISDERHSLTFRKLLTDTG